ncbi:hypothetical protein Btru_001076 [Bulinus truncatus]|nr:hypothetical protein Btru_001076 [Bulinus truncatus]
MIPDMCDHSYDPWTLEICCGQGEWKDKNVETFMADNDSSFEFPKNVLHSGPNIDHCSVVPLVFVAPDLPMLSGPYGIRGGSMTNAV